jgi:hypothetical protein
VTAASVAAASKLSSSGSSKRTLWWTLNDASRGDGLVNQSATSHLMVRPDKTFAPPLDGRSLDAEGDSLVELVWCALHNTRSPGMRACISHAAAWSMEDTADFFTSSLAHSCPSPL